MGRDRDNLQLYEVSFKIANDFETFGLGFFCFVFVFVFSVAVCLSFHFSVYCILNYDFFLSICLSFCLSQSL